MENTLRNIRHQVKENSEELQDFIRDLGNWEKDIKRKDEELRKRAKEPAKYSTESSENEADLQRRRQKSVDSSDVEKQLEKKEGEEQENEKDSGEEDEEDDADLRRLKQKALVDKDRGNQFFSEGKYDDAIACYTSGIQADPTNAVLPANRAMAFIKKGQLAAAEQDCTLSISLDYSYAKAFYRRGTCRMALKKLQLARQDFLKVMEMEPGNKFARLELDKLEEMFRKQDAPRQEKSVTSQNVPQLMNFPTSKPTVSSSDTTTSTHRVILEPKSLDPQTSDREVNKKPSIFSSLPDQVKPVYKATHLRSKKPLERIAIEVHSSDEETEEQAGLSTVHQRPSSLPTVGGNTSRSPSTQAPSTPIVTPTTPKALPPIPQTAYQFESDWRKLRHWPSLRVKYLKTVAPDSLKQMYRQSMDTDIFIDIIHCLEEVAKEDKEGAFQYLRSLTRVGRFSTTILFLSPSETQIIKNTIQMISPAIPDEEIKVLQSLYGI